MIGPDKPLSFSMSESINEIAEAMAKAQGEIKAAIKDAKNPHFKSSYADLASAWDACRDAVSRNGIAVVQIPTSKSLDYVTVSTMLMHKSGQWLAGELSLPLERAKTAQAAGSAITYARRYSLMAMVGIAPDDDDGNAASGVGQQSKGKDPAIFNKNDPEDVLGIENLFKEKGLVLAHWRPIKDRMHGRVKSEVHQMIDSALTADKKKATVNDANPLP